MGRQTARRRRYVEKDFDPVQDMIREDPKLSLRAAWKTVGGKRALREECGAGSVVERPERSRTERIYGAGRRTRAPRCARVSAVGRKPEQTGARVTRALCPDRLDSRNKHSSRWRPGPDARCARPAQRNGDRAHDRAEVGAAVRRAVRRAKGPVSGATLARNTRNTWSSAGDCRLGCDNQMAARDRSQVLGKSTG